MAASAQQEGRRGSRVEARVGFINASPLVQICQEGRREKMEQLGAAKEEEIIRDILRTSGFRIGFRAVVATPSRVGELLNDGCQIIHYVGHGNGERLSFESDSDRHCGIMAPLKVDALKGLFPSKHVGTTLVFISSCCSELTGKAFVDAGVRHVVAVKAGESVADEEAHLFAKLFYGALLGQQRHEVQEAFNRASAIASAGANAGNSNGQGGAFILLPRGGNHDVRIFDQVPRGDYIEETLPLPEVHPCLPGAREPYLGIQAVQKLLRPLLCPLVKCVTVVGERGSGKTQRVIQACKYVRERRKFDAMYFVTCDEIVEKDDDSPPRGRGPVQDPRWLIGRALGMDPAPSSVEQLADFLFRQEEGRPPPHTVLLVLDGIDALVEERDRDARDRFCKFMSSLCSRKDSYKLKLLVTSNFWLQHGSNTCFKTGTERVLKVAPLEGTDPAQLFFNTVSRPLTRSELGVGPGCSHAEKLEALLGPIEKAKGHPATLVLLASKIFDIGLNSPLFVKNAVSLRESFHRASGQHPLPDNGGTQQRARGTASMAGLNDPGCFLVWVRAIENAKADDERNGSRGRPMAGGAVRGRTDHAPLKYLSDGLQDLLHQQQTTSSNHYHTGGDSPYDVLDGTVDLGDWGDYGAIDAPTPRSINDKEMFFVEEHLRREQKRVACGGRGTRARGLGLDDDGDDQHAISIEAFVRFSEWWAPVMATLSRLRDDWSSADLVRLHGFVGREAAYDMLSRKKQGTFLLRFSESVAGALAINVRERAPSTSARAPPSLCVKKYLVKVDEAGKFHHVCGRRLMASFTSLPDLVLNWNAMQTLYPDIPKENAFQEVSPESAPGGSVVVATPR